jgi:hypothetical protein
MSTAVATLVAVSRPEQGDRGKQSVATAEAVAVATAANRRNLL